MHKLKIFGENKNTKYAKKYQLEIVISCSLIPADVMMTYVNWLEKLRESSIKSRYRVYCSWSVLGSLKTRVYAVTDCTRYR